MNPQWSNQQQQQRLAPQQTGWQQPMMTGYGGNPGMMQQQPMQQMQQMPQMQMQPQMTGMPSMQTGYPGMSPGPRFGQAPPMPMMPQATGYPGQPQQQGQGSQMLGSFSAVPSTFVSTFMPSNPNANWSSGPAMPQQQQQAPAPLPQYFQQHNQQAMGQNAVQVQWSLTADERRKYDQIFRAWDKGSGYITGDRAQEVFKESGLDRDDLMKVWALADRENRGKLNLAEFHVAMGLIYRRLSGNPLPDVLPQELIPPSSRDLNQSVDFLKDLLRSDTNARSTNLDPMQDNSRSGGSVNKYSKVRSFNANASPDPSSGNRKDATGYKHDDTEVKTYKSSSRHLDRRNVRFQGDDDDDDSELASMKRDLLSTQAMLDGSHAKEEEDEDLKAEIDDLKYRIRRVKDDIEYNKTGRRSEAKDEDRRRLERELLFLMHEKLPELEQKMRERERTKRSDDRASARKRDVRNNGGRHDREQTKARSGSNGDEDDSDDSEEKARGYMRGSYGQASKTKNGRSRDEDESDSRDTSPRNTNSAAPPPPSAPPAASQATHAAPPPPVPATSSSPAPKKPQTPEERQAFIRAEAQRRVQERMRVLTGQAPSAAPTPEVRASSVDSTVQQRLEQDKKEAAEKAMDEDKAVQEREKLRQLKLEEERLGRIKKEEKTLADTNRALQKVSNEITASEMTTSGGNRDASNAAREELDSEEKAMHQREEALQAEKRQREERMKKLEAELEETRRQEEEFEKKKSIFASKSKAPPPPVPAARSGKGAPPKPPPSRNQANTAKPVVSPTPATQPAREEALAPASAPSAPSAPPAPPAPSAPEPPKAASTNPFHRLGPAGGAASTAASPSPNSAPRGPNNPFFRPPTGAITAPTSTPPPVAQPVPIRPKASSNEEDWGDAKDKSDDDSGSSDDEAGPSVQQKRAGLAGLLFGGTSSPAPTSRPSSAQAQSPAGRMGQAPPGPPKPPAGPLPKLGAQAGSPPPRSALLGAIQGGARLRKTTTVDKSQAAGAGSVIGDASAPVQQYVPPPSPPRSPSPPPQAAMTNMPPSNNSNANRQSVDWYGGLAADSYPTPASAQANGNSLPTMEEESEDEDDSPAEFLPALDGSPEASGPEADFDMSSSTRVRSLYAYQAQRDQDASFSENLLIVAHPPKDPNSDWLYGIVPSTGSRGWLPKSYVEELPFNTPAKVLYDYEGQTEDELSVQAGASVFIGDKLDSDWARAVLDGKVGLVPLAYLEEPALSTGKPEAGPVPALAIANLNGIAPPVTPTMSMVSPRLSESEDENDGPEDMPDATATAAREQERLRVLQAAGIVVQQAPVRDGPRRRPPPPRPRPLSTASNLSLSGAHSPALTYATADEDQPNNSADTKIAADDAYAKWEQLHRDMPLSNHGAVAPQELPAIHSAPRPVLAPSSSTSPPASGRLLSFLKELTSNPGNDKRSEDYPPAASVTTSTFTPHIAVSALGQTWSSLIEPGALQAIPEQERKRQEAIFELVKSESTYLESLQNIVQEFFTKLQPVLDDKASQVIFANIEDILLWSVTFLSDLEDRQRACRLYVDRVGDLVRQHMPGLGIYQPYCLNQANAARMLADLKAQDERVRDILTLRVHGLGLEHYLLEPMQRLARYPLLLQQILRYTDVDHSDLVDIKESIEISQKVLNDTNEGLRQQENEEKLAYLSDNLVFPDNASIRLDLTAGTRLMGKRKLIKEGMLIKGYNHKRQTKRKDLHTYLFNDFILLTTSSLGVKDRLSGAAHISDSITVYRAPMPLEELSVRPTREDQVLIISHRGEDFKVQASSSRQRQDWVQQIEMARQAVLSAKEQR